MGKGVSYSLLSIIGILYILTSSCSKEKTVTLPELSTSSPADITSASAASGGTISSDGGSAISARGVCWGIHYNPTVSDNITSDGSGAGTFLSSVTGLTSGTDYYIRAYATNSTGTAYGNELLFITPLTDNDGNVYNTVIIGTQVWMTENLRTTTFNDNTAIPNVSDNATWGTLSTPAYCWYKNDVYSNKTIYGSLYNWFSVNTGKLCPTGWHVADEKEWTHLADYLGINIAGIILKDVGTNHWSSPNQDASNAYGFSAMPGGYRTGLAAGSFRAMGYLGYWWTATEYDMTGARGRQMRFDSDYIIPGTGLKKNGYSVRCIKDNLPGK